MPVLQQACESGLRCNLLSSFQPLSLISCTPKLLWSLIVTPSSFFLFRLLNILILRGRCEALIRGWLIVAFPLQNGRFYQFPGNGCIIWHPDQVWSWSKRCLRFFLYFYKLNSNSVADTKNRRRLNWMQTVLYGMFSHALEKAEKHEFRNWKDKAEY